MNKEKLLLLADCLEKYEGKFDMRFWGMHEGDHPPEEDNYCGTAVCAMGLAAILPEFPDLQPEWFDETMDVRHEPTGAYGMSAGSREFDISPLESRFLFDNASYVRSNPTKEEVVTRIRDFVHRDTNWWEAPAEQIKRWASWGLVKDNEDYCD